jgi:HD-like signal output (HDOD) protein
MTTQTEESLNAQGGIQFSPGLEDFASKLQDVRFTSLGAIDLMQEMARPDISLKEVSEKLIQDPALSARVLRVANSSYYGTANRISTVGHAVPMLGVNEVKTLVQGLCMVELSTPNGALSEVFGGRAFAAHAMVVSFLSGCLAQRFKFQMLGKGEAESAGLLHDIGVCLLGSGDKRKYRDVQLQFWGHLEGLLRTPEGFSIVQVEREVLGFTHAELGGWLASEWNLPSNIQEALCFHHGSVAKCFNKEAVVVVQVAEALANRDELDFLPIGGCGGIHSTVCDFLESQGRECDFDKIVEEMSEDLAKAKKLYQLILEEGESAAPGFEDRDPVTPVQVAKQNARPSPLPRTVPVWAYFIVGGPQIVRGQTRVAGALIAAFIVSLLLFTFTVANGLAALSGAFLLVALLTWLLSVMSG